MPKILDQYGTPIDTGALKEPQTSRITTLENQYLTPMLAGLTPSKLSATLKQADDGDLTAQHRLFSDMGSATRTCCARSASASWP